MEKYSLQIIWSDEKEAYVAMVSEIPQVTQSAGTIQEAVQKIDLAMSAYLEEKWNRCEPAPPPRRLESYSGQFRLRLPRTLHAALAKDAETEGVSLNTYILHLLSDCNARKQSRRQVAAVQRVQVRKTVQFMHKRVANITVSNPSRPAARFSWRNESSATITQVQGG